ncbi:GNAT family N-acetyltransferase [Sediminicoccus sp. BL-A-41-H5]|uniref:GNAT family N-acetyltransferase n=1 Tax=Sediminicoccus sp. BL-A-41-H5 TaxID=3421106 RepID=UPI003D66B6D1
MTALTLRRATEADLPFVMATERREGYDALVGRWDEARHRAALRDGRHAHLLGQAGAEPIGFAILRDWASEERVTLIKRIAVAAPGQGWGRLLLSHVVEAAFRETPAHRLWLGVFPENLRARRAYEAVGFVAEGVARGSAFFGGLHRDELIMAILRPDWEKARGVHPGA